MRGKYSGSLSWHTRQIGALKRRSVNWNSSSHIIFRVQPTGWNTRHWRWFGGMFGTNLKARLLTSNGSTGHRKLISWYRDPHRGPPTSICQARCDASSAQKINQLNTIALYTQLFTTAVQFREREKKKICKIHVISFVRKNSRKAISLHIRERCSPSRCTRGGTFRSICTRHAGGYLYPVYASIKRVIHSRGGRLFRKCFPTPST